MITGVDETENTDIQQLKEELEFVQLAVNQRDNFRIRENVSLPAGKPEIQEIIWDDVDAVSYTHLDVYKRQPLR